MKVHNSFLWRIVLACAIHSTLYCSRIIFPGLFKKKHHLLKNANVCHQHPLVSLTHKCIKISQHYPLHAIHSCLANPLSTSNTRHSFKHFKRLRNFYGNSLIPSLARHLVNPSRGSTSNRPTFSKDHFVYIIIC